MCCQAPHQDAFWKLSVEKFKTLDITAENIEAFCSEAAQDYLDGLKRDRE